MADTVVVSLGEASYTIQFGGLGAIGTQLAPLGSPGRCVLVTNPVVAPLHLESLLGGLRPAGWLPEVVFVPDGEEAKCLLEYQDLVDTILALDIDRKTPIFALGGGVTGDLVGFAAATLLRGLPWVQVPTTLLAMIDSSVGGKTAVNTDVGKNLVGAFHQPRLVWIDVDVLSTLPRKELLCGWGEAIKHAFLDGEESISWLEEHTEKLLQGDAAVVAEAVARSCAFKAGIVQRDEREAGERALLNLGHTVAHALEQVAGYGQLGHGQAVGIGMLAEARFAVDQGWASAEVPQRMASLLGRFGLPLLAPPLSVGALKEAVTMDKKACRGRLKLPLVEAIGEVRLREVAIESISEALTLAVQEEMP